MHFKTVKDVVDFSRRLHVQISELYERLSQDTAQARVSMLLDYLKRHEKHLEETLCKFEKDKSQSVLNSWLQYAPDQNLDDVLASININNEMDVDDVVLMALKLDDYFIDLYQGMVDSSGSSAVKAVFQNLLDMEQQEKIQLAKTALQVHDI